ncbi:MAG: Crp/Fnr family transcriptional regulator [Myxococcota bacterium]|nr:Crp/Fnr family transcriptional regulator [Myxococcota bacterium]
MSSSARIEDTQFRVQRSYERTLRPGDVLYDEGERGDRLYVIQAGQMDMSRAHAGGRKLVARLGPGELFGEMGVLLGRPRTQRAEAASDVRLLEIDPVTFEGMCVEQPEIAIRVIQRLAARAIDLEQRLSALGAEDLLRPVVRVILRSAQPGAGDEGVAGYDTSLRELAQKAGLSMLEAYRALGQLLDRRLVKLIDDSIQVPDLEALSSALDPAD